MGCTAQINVKRPRQPGSAADVHALPWDRRRGHDSAERHSSIGSRSRTSGARGGARRCNSATAGAADERHRMTQRRQCKSPCRYASHGTPGTRRRSVALSQPRESESALDGATSTALHGYEKSARRCCLSIDAGAEAGADRAPADTRCSSRTDSPVAMDADACVSTGRTQSAQGRSAWQPARRCRGGARSTAAPCRSPSKARPPEPVSRECQWTTPRDSHLCAGATGGARRSGAVAERRAGGATSRASAHVRGRRAAIGAAPVR
jgi:hypothetical protein